MKFQHSNGLAVYAVDLPGLKLETGNFGRRSLQHRLGDSAAFGKIARRCVRRTSAFKRFLGATFVVSFFVAIIFSYPKLKREVIHLSF